MRRRHSHIIINRLNAAGQLMHNLYAPSRNSVYNFYLTANSPTNRKLSRACQFMSVEDNWPSKLLCNVATHTAFGAATSTVHLCRSMDSPRQPHPVLSSELSIAQGHFRSSSVASLAALVAQEDTRPSHRSWVQPPTKHQYLL